MKGNLKKPATKIIRDIFFKCFHNNVTKIKQSHNIFFEKINIFVQIIEKNCIYLNKKQKN